MVIVELRYGYLGGELMEHNPMAMENARNSQQGAPR